MTKLAKIAQGTPEWLHMVGVTLTDAANEAGLPNNQNLVFLERYTDGEPIGGGLIQGLRLDLRNGKAFYRIGAGVEEESDVVIEVSRYAARQLNLRYSHDPAYIELVEEFYSYGQLKVVRGDISDLKDWIASTHDLIVGQSI